MFSISIPEALAIFFALAYLFLASKENILCWYCAFVSSVIYTVIFWEVNLLMDSLLNIFYVVMAVLGWIEWRSGKSADKKVRTISMLPLWKHGVIIVSILVLSILNGWFMQHYTEAAWPFIDSFTTWASIISTFLVIYKILETWFYWFVIDGISIFLYIDRGLTPTAVLFMGYVVMVIFCYLQWRKVYLGNQAKLNQTPT